MRSHVLNVVLSHMSFDVMKQVDTFVIKSWKNQKKTKNLSFFITVILLSCTDYCEGLEMLIHTRVDWISFKLSKFEKWWNIKEQRQEIILGALNIIFSRINCFKWSFDIFWNINQFLIRKQETKTNSLKTVSKNDNLNAYPHYIPYPE